MKIVFLDIDGVLNSEMFFNNKCMDDNEMIIDPVPVNRLVNICKNNTDVRIVLTSLWRQGDISLTKKRLCKCHENIIPLIPYMIDETIRRYDRNRGKEIKQWLRNCPMHIDSYVILDDDDFDIDDENLIKVDSYYGLYGENVLDIYRKLRLKFLY